MESGSPLCVMIGVNGYGKTLDVLALVAKSAEGRLRESMTGLSLCCVRSS
jgi:predicted ATPase